MQLAIQTTALSPSTPESLTIAQSLGFQMVEIHLHPHEFGYDFRRKPSARFYRQLKTQLDSLNLSVWSTTAVPLTQSQMFYERARKDILLGGITAAGILGSRVYVVQPADIFNSEMAVHHYFTEKTAPPVIEGFDESWVQGVNRRVNMALLNLDYWLGLPLTNQIERIEQIGEQLAIGWAMDVRLAHHRTPLTNWLEVLKKRLAVAYFYDLDEQGRTVAPHDPIWQEWLPLLRHTSLKCAVIRAGTHQTLSQIADSFAYLSNILAQNP